MLAWRQKRAPSVPDVPYILKFAVDFQLNPSWLLLGAGSERIEPIGLPEPIEEAEPVVRVVLNWHEEFRDPSRTKFHKTNDVALVRG